MFTRVCDFLKWHLLLVQYAVLWNCMFNTLRPRLSRRHFADDRFRYIFLNENILISIKKITEFIAKGPINKLPALVQIMAWRRPGDKPLFEAMMVRFLTHICVAQPQWDNSALKTRVWFACQISNFCALPSLQVEPISSLLPFNFMPF